MSFWKKKNFSEISECLKYALEGNPSQADRPAITLSLSHTAQKPRLGRYLTGGKRKKRKHWYYNYTSTVLYSALPS